MAKSIKTKKGAKTTLRKFEQTHLDFIFALLIVSLIINMIFLIAWIALQVTDVYDAQVSALLFGNR